MLKRFSDAINDFDTAYKLWSDNIRVGFWATRKILHTIRSSDWPRHLFDCDDYDQTVRLAVWIAALSYDGRAKFTTWATMLSRQIVSAFISKAIRNVALPIPVEYDIEDECNENVFDRLQLLDEWKVASKIWEIAESLTKKTNSRCLDIFLERQSKTLEEIAAELGVTKQRIQQLDAKAVHYLRRASEIYYQSLHKNQYHKGDAKLIS